MKSDPKIEERIGVACMVVLTLITLGNVLTRYLTDQSFAWTEEISVFLIVVMTLAGAASAALRDGHIRIEYFYDGGSLARRRRLRAISGAITALVFLALAVLFSIDVADEIRDSPGGYDAILLDVDNGPEGLTSEANHQLYTKQGLRLAKAALRPGGVLAIWSAFRDAAFTARLERAGVAVDEVIVRARTNGKGPKHVIWFAQVA